MFLLICYNLNSLLLFIVDPDKSIMRLRVDGRNSTYDKNNTNKRKIRKLTKFI